MSVRGRCHTPHKALRSAAMRAWRRLLIACAVPASAVAAFAAPAQAEILCVDRGAFLSNNQTFTVGYDWSWHAQWYGDLDFIARRYNGTTETFHHFQDVQVYGHTYVFFNNDGSDAYRETRITRGGYAQAWNEIWTWSKHGCY